MVKKVGTAGKDKLVGGNSSDILSGLGGNDVLIGNGGNDTLKGGDGRDRLFGGAGNDRLDGGKDKDFLDGGAGNDVMVGGPGNDNDTYVVDSPDDVIIDSGGTGDEIRISFGFVTFELSTYAGGAIENVTLLAPVSFINVVIGNAANNTMIGNNFDNTFQGGAGNDSLFGNVGNDILIGGEAFNGTNSGDDFLDGGLGRDDLEGGDGRDTLIGGQGFDFLDGGAGADVFLYRAGDLNYGAFDNIAYEAIDTIDVSGLINVISADHIRTFISGVSTGNGGLAIDFDGLQFDNFSPTVFLGFETKFTGNVTVVADGFSTVITIN